MKKGFDNPEGELFECTFLASKAKIHASKLIQSRKRFNEISMKKKRFVLPRKEKTVMKWIVTVYNEDQINGMNPRASSRLFIPQQAAGY